MCIRCANNETKNYKKMDMSINKGECCTVLDNSNRVK